MKIRTKRVAVLTIGLCFILAFSMMSMSPTTAYRDRGGIIRVPRPTGDPAIDTPNIQAAFDEATQHRGWTVKLRAGTYVIDQTIAIINFDGTLKGAGKDRTFIQNAEDFYIHPLLGYPTMLEFVQGSATFLPPETESTASNPYSVRIQDFTMEFMCINTPYWDNLRAMTGVELVGRVSGEWDTDISYYDVFLKRVGFIGQPDPDEPYGYTGLNAFRIGGQGSIPNTGNKYVQGTYYLQDCTFEHLAFSFDLLGNFKDSTIICKRNTFHDVGECFFCRDSSGSFIDFSQNTATEITDHAIWIPQGTDYFWGVLGAYPEIPAPEVSHVRISGNDLSGDTNPDMDMIMLFDWCYAIGGPKSLRASLFWNHIQLDGDEASPAGGGIFSAWVHDSWAVGNTISGVGFMGIYLGLWGDFWGPMFGTVPTDDSGWKILFNDVSDLTVISTYYTFFGYEEGTEAPIWLGPYTSDNLVVHIGEDTDVRDFGSNTIIIF